MMKFKISIIFCIYFSIFNSSCSKDSTKTPTPWDTCSNKFTQDFNFRKGKWKRSQIGGILVGGFNFKNDSIVDILSNTNPDIWKYDVKYRMQPCHVFEHNQYWIQPQNPAFQYWNTYVRVNFNDSTKELSMSYAKNGSIDTIRFKKE